MTSPTTRPSGVDTPPSSAFMGRIAAESGKMVTSDEALQFRIELAPRLVTMTTNSPPLVKPDAKGHYPVAMPGLTVTV